MLELGSMIMRPTEVIEGASLAELSLDALLADPRPKIFRGLVSQWPLVVAGKSEADRPNMSGELGKSGKQGGSSEPQASGGSTAGSDASSAIAYVKRFDAGQPVVGYTGAPEIGGRFFYRDDWSGLNFEGRRVGLSAYLDRMAEHLHDPDAPSFYVGSTDLDRYLPGFRAENDLGLAPPLPGRDPPLASIWIGNRTTAATHYDMSNNLACCLVGRRRFTLFPPDQVANLYPGPLEPTPGGQVVSMVDLRAPDLDRYPGFAEATANAEVADLEPGDVLFYPALWWHNVEALDPFNVMVNYWWNAVSAFADSPMTTLLHGMLALRERPEAEKRAWSALFDYYVFGPSDRPAAHLPREMHGELAPLDDLGARRLRAKLIDRLNR